MARLDTLVRSLAGFRPRRGLCLSLFLDLDPGRVPTAHELESHVTALVDEAMREVDELARAVDHDVLRAAREDAERAASFLAEGLDRSGRRALALYLCGLESVRHEVPLSAPVADAVAIGRAFVLAPLLASLERDRELILAAVGRDRGTLWRCRDGDVVQVGELSRDGQGQHDQGGWSQARYARSREREALDHFREVAGAIGDAIEPGAETLVVVACVEEQRAIVEELLPPHVRETLLGFATIEAHGGAETILPEAERLLELRLEAERQALLERWREQAPAGLAAGSWEAAIAAASDGRVEALLVDGRTSEAWDCPACGRGSPAPGRCALDGQRLEATLGGALELCASGTLRHRGEVRLARPGTLEETDGVAALLRYALESTA